MVSGNKLFMGSKADPQTIGHEDWVYCIDCHFLFQPNPEEDIFICLRSLEIIDHGVEEIIKCCGYQEVRNYWKPVFVASLNTYV